MQQLQYGITAIKKTDAKLYHPDARWEVKLFVPSHVLPPKGETFPTAPFRMMSYSGMTSATGTTVLVVLGKPK